MRKDEIQIGKTYTNGKKREIIRQVVNFSDNPYYMHFKTIKGFAGNDYCAVLKTSFAKWAKSEVKESQDEKA